MKKELIFVLIVFACGCKKNKANIPDTDTPFATEAGKQYGLSIRDNMLYFESAVLYDQLVSKSEEEAMAILEPYEQTGLFTSLSEKRGYAWRTDNAYTPLIATLLNNDQMIAIEGKIFRINAEQGKVFAIAANDRSPKLLSELAAESSSSKAIETRSVDEDLSTLLDAEVSKYGPLGGCPTTGQDLSNTTYREFVSTNASCNTNNTTLRLYAKPHYKRYGILFELFAEGYGQPYSCHTITGYVYRLSYRGNKSGWSQVYQNNFSFSLNSNGLYKFYSASYRLCNFNLKCSMKTYNTIYELETPVSGITFNFDAWE